MILIHAGQQRTGSFATYQIAREILLMHGLGFAPPWNYGYPGKVDDWVRSEEISVLLKFHECPEGLFENWRPRILFTIRDPRDVFCSLMAKKGYTSKYLLYEAHHFQKVLNQEASWRPHLDEYRDLIVRYEDFVVDPLGTAKTIGQWLGTNVRPDEAEYIVGKWSLARNRQRAIDGHHRNSLDYMNGRHISVSAGKVGRWRELLTADEIARVEEMAEGWMERHGYA
jgi:hypothetical protein